MTRDPDIRAMLHAELDRRLPPGAVVIDEYGLGCNIADVAVFTPHALHIFEIKSDADTPRRLADQARSYGRYCTTATLVAGFGTAEACSKIVPEWRGVIAAWEGGLEPVREAQLNPDQNPEPIAGLLWASEAKDELRARGLWKGMSRESGWGCRAKLVETLSVDELRETVHRRVRQRQWILSRTPPRVIGEAVAA